MGQMAAGIAHEIRNPMTTVRGFLQLLKINSDFSKYEEYFDLMINELDRANSIISGFLSLSLYVDEQLPNHQQEALYITP